MLTQKSFTCGLAVLGFTLLLAAGCGGLRVEHPILLRQGDWPTTGRTVDRDAFTPATLRPPLVKEWEVDIAAGVGSGSPLVVDSMAIVGTMRGELQVVHLRTGRKIGWTKVGDAVSNAPVADGNFVICPVSGGGESLVSYNINEGKIAWKISGGDVEMSPLILRQRVYFGSTSGSVYCVDRVNGVTVWKYEIPDNNTFQGFRSTPAATDSLVFFGGDNGMVYAFAAENGAMRWQSPARAPIAGGMTVGQGIVVTGTTAGQIVAFDAATGAEQWRYAAGAPVYSPPAAAGDTIIVGTLGGIVYAISAKDGTLIWKTTVDGPVNSAAVIAGDIVYLGTLRKQLVALRRNDGVIAWQFETDGRIKTAPAVAHGRLLVATDERTLLSLKEAAR